MRPAGRPAGPAAPAPADLLLPQSCPYGYTLIRPSAKSVSRPRAAAPLRRRAQALDIAFARTGGKPKALSGESDYAYAAIRSQVTQAARARPSPVPPLQCLLDTRLSQGRHHGIAGWRRMHAVKAQRLLKPPAASFIAPQ